MAKKRNITIEIKDYKFYLKDLKIHEDMSDETTCYSAKLVCNGKVIAYCKNDGIGGETEVFCYASDPDYDLYRKAMLDIRYERDREFEEDMTQYAKEHNFSCENPWVQYYTLDHLADSLMAKQRDWNSNLPQLKKYAKKWPTCAILFNGHTVKAALQSFKEQEGWEDITEYVR